MLKEKEILKQSIHYHINSLLILFGMASLLALTTYLLAGGSGLFWVLVIGLISLFLSPQVNPTYMLNRGRFIHPSEAPKIYRIIQYLSEKAGLPRLPKLYLIPSNQLNAMAMGTKQKPLVAITQGLAQQLDLQEIEGVLAHEISHIKNGDTQVMLWAYFLGRATRIFSFVGRVLLILNLPLLLMGQVFVSWWLILVLMSAPGLSFLLQMALSRTREFKADLEAAKLTGNPEGLAQALEKLEFIQQRANWWNAWIRVPRAREIPQIWRSHPITQDRVARLRAMVKKKFPFQDMILNQQHWI